MGFTSREGFWLGSRGVSFGLRGIGVYDFLIRNMTLNPKPILWGLEFIGL